MVCLHQPLLKMDSLSRTNFAYLIKVCDTTEELDAVKKNLEEYNLNDENPLMLLLKFKYKEVEKEKGGTN